MNKLSIREYVKWTDDYVKIQLKWAREGSKFSEKELSAFEAGIRSGFSGARATLFLHDVLSMV